jgi:hypothetical protein
MKWLVPKDYSKVKVKVKRSKPPRTFINLRPGFTVTMALTEASNWSTYRYYVVNSKNQPVSGWFDTEDEAREWIASGQPNPNPIKFPN